jgi:polar amino acid transport system substrate-binding protein
VLRDAVKSALERLVASGAYAELLKRWGLEQNAIPAITVNAGR